jgi:hypothetical protein
LLPRFRPVPAPPSRPVRTVAAIGWISKGRTWTGLGSCRRCTDQRGAVRQLVVLEPIAGRLPARSVGEDLFGDQPQMVEVGKVEHLEIEPLRPVVGENPQLVEHLFG